METKEIKDGIVFSNDIERIMRGDNALGFNYANNKIIMPNDVSDLRKSFRKDVNNIFNNNVTIISEEEMLESLASSISDVLGVCPHCIFG